MPREQSGEQPRLSSNAFTDYGPPDPIQSDSPQTQKIDVESSEGGNDNTTWCFLIHLSAHTIASTAWEPQSVAWHYDCISVQREPRNKSNPVMVPEGEATMFLTNFITFEVIELGFILAFVAIILA